MSFQLDHIIHFTSNPERTKEALQALGLHTVTGGRHETFGTYNALSYFHLSYIELMGVFDQTLVESQHDHPHSLQATLREINYEDGAARISVRTNDIEGDAKRFKGLGLEVFGPMGLSRKRPDGTVLSWKLLFVGKEGINPELPFLIEWDDSDEDRLQELTEHGTIAPHPIGNITLKSIGFAVKDLEAATKDWAKFLQLEIEKSYIDETLNAKAQVLLLEGGNIVFYEPIGDGKVKDILNKRGEKPFLIEFENEKEERDIEIFGTIYRFKTYKR